MRFININEDGLLYILTKKNLDHLTKQLSNIQIHYILLICLQYIKAKLKNSMDLKIRVKQTISLTTLVVNAEPGKDLSSLSKKHKIANQFEKDAF